MYRPTRKAGPRRQDAQFTGKIRLRQGDTVRVLAGKDRGKEGKITEVLRSEGKVIVEGINVVIKHEKPRPSPSGQSTGGGRVEKTMPMHVAKVQLVDPADGKSVTRIGVKLDGNGERVRFARKSGGVISNG